MAPKTKPSTHTVASLAARVEALEARCEQLEAVNAIRANTIDLLKEHTSMLEERLDRAEQYSKRPCLRIHGVPVAAKGTVETNEKVMKIVQDVHAEIKVPFNEKNIDRAHRVGQKLTKDGKTTQSIIVKFSNWNARCAFYRSRPTMSKPIPDKKAFNSIGLDLTKQRIDLLAYARQLVEGEDRVSYAFCDINCNCMLKMVDGTFKLFNNKEELQNLLVEE